MKNDRSSAYRFIILMGIVSLFGDITYEGARSITGPYLFILGASATAVGFVSGIGELLGYALRLASGYFADRTKAYWIFATIGYGLILSIPMLCIANTWQAAAVFIVIERIGKAVRSPSRDVILSGAAAQVGSGWGFAIHEAMDQIGAILGPLVFTAAFILRGGYKAGFIFLFLPAVLCIVILLLARKFSAQTANGPSQAAPDSQKVKLTGSFKYFSIFTFLSAGGYVSFQLLSFHFKITAAVSDAYIPIFYSLAMGVDALSALATGKLYDRIGFKVLALIPLFTAPIAFLAFKGSLACLVSGVVLWGIVMGMHETIMRAAVCDVAPSAKKGTAYGIFNTVYGVSALAGNTLFGFLYGISPAYVVLLSAVMQGLAAGSLVPLLKLKPSTNC